MNTTQHIFVALWDMAMKCERAARIPAGQVVPRRQREGQLPRTRLTRSQRSCFATERLHGLVQKRHPTISLRTLAQHSSCRSERWHRTHLVAQNAGTALICMSSRGLYPMFLSLRTTAPRSSACPPLDCTPCSCAAETCVSHRTSVVDPRPDSNIRSSDQTSPSDSYLAVRGTPPGCHGDSNGRSSRRRNRPTSSRKVAPERRSISPTR